MSIPLLMILCLLAVRQTPVHAKDASIDPETDSRLDLLLGSHEPYAGFLATLKTAAAHKDWASLSHLIAYPLRVMIGQHRVDITTPAQFEARAAAIMSPRVVRAIQMQAYRGIFANTQGVMIGDGEVWFSGICSSTDCSNVSVKITAIAP